LDENILTRFGFLCWISIFQIRCFANVPKRFLF